METSKGYLGYHQSPSFASSMRDVTYSCGSCGYQLNLSSSSRNTSTIGSKYGKSIKKGIISFFYIDETRFNQVEEFKCVPYFISKYSFGLFRRRTKLFCRNCVKVLPRKSMTSESVACNHLQFKMRLLFCDVCFHSVGVNLYSEKSFGAPQCVYIFLEEYYIFFRVF